jgi:hypothetical protein
MVSCRNRDRTEFPGGLREQLFECDWTLRVVDRRAQRQSFGCRRLVQTRPNFFRGLPIRI